MKPAARTALPVAALLTALLVLLSSPHPQQQTPSLSDSEVAAIASEMSLPGRPRDLLAALDTGANSTIEDSQPAVEALPAAVTGADVVLNPADVGPDFVLASSGQKTQAGLGWTANTYVRAGRHTYFIEPDGAYFVRSLALVAPSPFDADRIFDQAAGDILQGMQELPVASVGERARGAVEWGDGPFELAGKVVLFRARNVVGYVRSSAFDTPADLNDVVPLAQAMAARAGR